jgi:transcriptional regulator with XRE-family HTH domain
VKTYGAQLRALRGKVPQEAIAAKMGYKRQGNLSLYENDIKRPSVQTVLRHAAAFGQQPSEFLRDVIVTEYDRIRAGEYDENRQSAVSGSRTMIGERAKSLSKESGEALAAPAVQYVQTPALSNRARTTVRRVSADIERIARDAEQANAVGGPTDTKRVVGEHAPAPRDHPADRGPRPRKHRR